MTSRRTFARLLAKSCLDPDRPPAPATLRGHIMLVCEAADELLAARGMASLQSVGLPADRLHRLERIVRLGAFVHDLGKCSEHYQEMVLGRRQSAQMIRHEAASLWLCWPGQPIAGWLRSAVEREEDMLVALVAAAGHHRKFWSHALCFDGAGGRCDLLTDHDDFVTVLKAGARRLGLGAPPDIGRHVVELGRHRLARQFEDWESEWNRVLEAQPEGGVLAQVAKALVLAADVAGSALPRADLRPAWIRGELARRASADEFAAIARDRLAANSPRPFQLEVSTSAAPVTFVRAGCGTGKTVAAYLWAAQHAGRQLWVTYPTTGTTTEGYRDYVADQTDLFARLEHGRREIDLEVFDRDRDDRDDSDSDEPTTRRRTRIEALGTWGAKVVVCTVDTVLGLVQNHRKGLYGWPGLSQSAVVFDEIHSYDDALFGALLRFLQAMPGTPALLMTASLPTARLEALRGVSERVHGRSLVEIAGPPDLEQLLRYERSYDEPVRAARACLAAGGKVLWVSNTVDRCIEVADHLPGALVYHSRFRYLDRVEQHRAVVAAFAGPGAAIVTSTQVAEISLDLSADLLITDHAPVPALIQRLGRLNRRATRGASPTRVCPFIVLSVTNPLPYKAHELEGAERWLGRLGDGPLSQAALAAAWDAEPDPVASTTVASTWVDGGFSTEVGDLRLATPGLTVLREEDVAEVRRTPSRAIALALPMGVPKGITWKQWRLVAHLPVAPSTALSYDTKRGGRWH